MTWEPVATPESEPYWEGVRAGELRLPRCRECDRLFFYPRAFCPRCGSRDLAWETVDRGGTIASYVVVERPLPGIAEEVPYIVAIVELDAGVRVTSRLVDTKPAHDSSLLGAAVEVVFRPQGEAVLPCVALAEA